VTAKNLIDQDLSEDDIQIQVADHAALFQKQCGFLFFHVPNQAMGKALGKGGLYKMVRLKRMGLRPGVADLVFVKAGRAYFLEMKKPGGRQSDSQKLFEADCLLAGSEYAIANSFDMAINILRKWQIIP
jgi:hypothetical protein